MAALLVVACSSGAPTTPPTTTLETFPEALPQSTSSTAAKLDTGDVTGFAVGEVLVDGESWTVAIASGGDDRARGLMGVDDLGDIDGMLFVFDEPALVTFWMKNTLIPLDIAFFGGDARLTEVLTMPVCEADPCPTYQPGQLTLYALEAPAGNLQGLAESAVLVLAPDRAFQSSEG